jgi:hypothetical protein
MSQSLAPFGVGAILDILGESFVACDTSTWKGLPHKLRLGRLEDELSVSYFRRPPVRRSRFGQSAEPGVPYFRFPRWLFCSNRACRRMTHWLPRWDRDSGGEVARCSSCHRRRALVPMRFVQVCPEGHLDDVPWDIWAHSAAASPAQRQCRAAALAFRTRPGAGTGLASLVVQCVAPGCGAERSLAGVSESGSLRQVGITCRGLHPWQAKSAARPHDMIPEVIQRGATNLHFAHVVSALDIPPESRYAEFGAATLRITGHGYFELLLSAIGQPGEEFMVGTMATDLGVTRDEIRRVAHEEAVRRGLAVGKPEHETDIQTGEWLAFTTPLEDVDERDRFVTRHVAVTSAGMPVRAARVADALFENIGQVVLATKLRELRALSGFSRYEPSGTSVPPDLVGKLDWLPGIEVFGEGVFLTLDEAALRRWEAGPAPGTC